MNSLWPALPHSLVVHRRHIGVSHHVPQVGHLLAYLPSNGRLWLVLGDAQCALCSAR